MKGTSNLTIGSWLACVNQFIDASTRFLSTREAEGSHMAKAMHFKWPYCIISMHLEDSGPHWWHNQIALLRLCDFAGYVCYKTHQNTLLQPSYCARDLCTSCANEQGSDENHPIKNCFFQRCKTSAWSLVNQKPCLQWGKRLVTSHKSSSELSTKSLVMRIK